MEKYWLLVGFRHWSPMKFLSWPFIFEIIIAPMLFVCFFFCEENPQQPQQQWPPKRPKGPLTVGARCLPRTPQKKLGWWQFPDSILLRCFSFFLFFLKKEQSNYLLHQQIGLANWYWIYIYTDAMHLLSFSIRTNHPVFPQPADTFAGWDCSHSRPNCPSRCRPLVGSLWRKNTCANVCPGSFKPPQ